MIQHEWLTVDENYPVIIKCSQDADGEFLIPEGVIGIAPYAFKDCTLLKDIILPESLEYINQHAFDGCRTEMFCRYDGVRYVGTAGNPYKFLVGPVSPDEITRCRIHEDCEIICEAAFENCSNLTQVVFNRHLLKIENSAFSGTGLIEADLPDGIEDVEFYTFRSCKDLRRIRIPESVEFIDPIAFDECPSSLTVECLPQYSQSFWIIYYTSPDNIMQGLQIKE